MSRITILSEALANQIAAGEVVERPASVVKELLENALDAGASQITVQIEGAGSRLIRVIDNGCGMDQDDALLCLERHATSKLRQADDLHRLKTLGFRGEAIPSIASVSRLTLTSRPQGASLGSRVEVRFGTVLKVHEMGCGQGTVVEVADLFANVPARRKFLKSAPTELAHIDEVVRSYALINCQATFSYQVNGREVLDLPASPEAADRRVKQAFGDCPQLIPLTSAESGARSDIRVSGFLLPPEQSAGRAGRLWTFVNGRYIKDRMVNHAVAEGMQGFLMKGGRLAGVLHLHLPPEAVDVNVHPTKQEVRFSEANLVHNKIVAAVWRSLEDYQERLKGELFGRPRSVAEPRPGLAGPAPEARLQASAAAEAATAARPPESGAALELREPGAADFKVRPRSLFGEGQPSASPPSLSGLAAKSAPSPAPPPRPAPTLAATAATPASPRPPAASPPVVQPAPPVTADATPDLAVPAPAPQPETPAAVPLRYLGQLFDTYLLCQAEDGLVAIDQHAVQERLIFEDLLAHYRATSMPGQVLLFPEMVELAPAEIQAVEHYGAELARLGLDLQDFGGDTLLIKAVPAALGHLPPSEVLRGILRRYLDDPTPGNEAARLEDILATMACKSAIKAGHALTELEVQYLLDRMQRAGIFSHCPHGRSVLKRFSRAEVERWFQRS